MLNLTLSIMLALSAGAIGGVLTAKSIPTWYRTLNKPAWNPPNWVFGPVWSALYVLMGVSAWMVWERAGVGGTPWWLAIYLTQLGLNLAWSLIFFGMHQPKWAFLEIIALWLSILATIIFFWPISPLAACLLLPYLAWVSFAGVLNASIWRLNT